MRLLQIQRCFCGFCYVTEEDLKLFNRNLLASLHENTMLYNALCMGWFKSASLSRAFSAFVLSFEISNYNL